MTDEQKPADKLTEEEVELIRVGAPIVKAIVGFGKVSKWLAIAAIGLLGGAVFLGESIAKLLGWIWPAH